MPGSNTDRAGMGKSGCSIANFDSQAGPGIGGAGTGSGGPSLRGRSGAAPVSAAGNGATGNSASPAASIRNGRKKRRQGRVNDTRPSVCLADMLSKRRSRNDVPAKMPAGSETSQPRRAQKK
ncbi:MAG: hypothetical protein OXE57_04765 [Alphaproteobacteria bacterium]|nr:hypothetical protein [Alphaproteobacteria bacterium]